MKAAIYEVFGKPFGLKAVADPEPDEGGVIVSVKATGICRSDWHGWMGHDPDIILPHVPGHELSGVVEEVGRHVTRWQRGDRVTAPFVCGCGKCSQCMTGNHQVCDHQSQPGFTHWGSFAEFVAIKYADINLVRLPEKLDFVTAASLGCRFMTSFRAVVAQGRVSPGQWVAVHGCGGVGLSAIMIANAIGARVIGIDISTAALELAETVGAAATLNATEAEDIAEAIKEITGGGAHVSLDALGSVTTCLSSILCLRKRGRHVQVGLMLADQSMPALPMAQVIANELEIAGTHGMQAHQFPVMLEMIVSGKLNPRLLVGKTVTLEDAPVKLQSMGNFAHTGVTVIDRF
ncbi:MAG: zinc-dependent alcohol dehydrogenase family protein [Desulfobacteraceae bacterium]|nr:MAG: zinc-dependent alcohol dehydrogenase family protein [Desulfobacteraceae bacterium]